MDRDVSTTSWDLYYYNDAPWAMAYNLNALASLRESTPARNLGSDVAALNGKLSVEPQWEYSVAGNAPKPVTLNNAGQSYPYPTSYQIADRLVRLTVRGWYNVSVHLRLIDPPDTAAYAPAGGWPAKGGKAAVPPYEAYDNDVWSETGYNDFGLTTHSDGSSPAIALDVLPGTNNTATFYLKLPHRYAGDNWQVEVTKKTPGGVTVPNKVPTYSALFTGWKRVFVERDKMFVQGGVLDPDVGSFPSGPWGNGQELPDDELALELNNQNICPDPVHAPCDPLPAPGIYINVFDAAHPSLQGYDQQAYITRAWVGQVGPLASKKDVLVVQLDQPLARTIKGQPITYTAGYADPTVNKSAGVGVMGSGFFGADFRAIDQTYDDAFVQVLAPRDGISSLPYFDENWFNANADNPWVMGALSKIWFKNFIQDSPGSLNDQPHNYFHVIGASVCDPLVAGQPTWILGSSYSQMDYSYIFKGTILALGGDAAHGGYGWTAQQILNGETYDISHELAHQFDVNSCSVTPGGGHDERLAWCDGDNHCGLDGTIPKNCLMHAPDQDATQMCTGKNKMCIEDLYSGDPVCTDTPKTGAIRTATDPK